MYVYVSVYEWNRWRDEAHDGRRGAQIYIYMHTYIIYVFIHLCMYTCMYMYVYIHIYVLYLYLYSHICIRMGQVEIMRLKTEVEELKRESKKKQQIEPKGALSEANAAGATRLFCICDVTLLYGCRDLLILVPFLVSIYMRVCIHMYIYIYTYIYIYIYTNIYIYIHI